MRIYVHIPFCIKKCHYCDFNSCANCTDEFVASYFQSLVKHIILASKSFDSTVDSIYFGGGTPSFVDERLIADTLQAIFDNFRINTDAEITIECNPDSLTEQKLTVYKACGFNRISIGVQSLSDENLRAVGRVHTSETAISKIQLAKEYFDNLSVDLIVGLPYDTDELIANEINMLCQYANHMSVYELILEENTPLHKMVETGILTLPNDDQTQSFFEIAISTLKQNGFLRYEISNFAKDKMISEHNFAYWTRDTYLGLGAGAHSLIKSDQKILNNKGEIGDNCCNKIGIENTENQKGADCGTGHNFDQKTNENSSQKSIQKSSVKVSILTNNWTDSDTYCNTQYETRFANVYDIADYIADINSSKNFDDVFKMELAVLDETEIKEEIVFLGLRTSRGISKKYINSENLAKYAKFFNINDDMIALNDKGMAVMNSILCEIL